MDIKEDLEQHPIDIAIEKLAQKYVRCAMLEQKTGKANFDPEEVKTVWDYIVNTERVDEELEHVVLNVLPEISDMKNPEAYMEKYYDDLWEKFVELWENAHPFTEAKLTTKQRNALPSSAFVFPKERKYPIHDISHARNALARVSQYGTPEEKRKVRSEVYKRYPSLRKSKSVGK